MATSKFSKFTEADYTAIYDKIVKKEVKILSDADAKDASGLPVEHSTVEVVQ